MEGSLEWHKALISQLLGQSSLTEQDEWDCYQLLLNIRQTFGLKDKAIIDYVLGISNYIKDLAEYNMLKTGSAKEYETYILCNLLEAPFLFDSYLVYLERKREYKSAFYAPKRKQFQRLGLIQALQDMEDGKTDITSISMPPSTQKTTLIKFFITWIIGKYPDDYNLFYSHSADITRIFYDGVLDITTNASEYCFNEIFPGVRLESTDAKAQRINFNNYKPYTNLQCTSVGAKNAGRVRCNRYLLCDDLIGGIEEALNKLMLDKIWNYYSVDAFQRKMDGCKELHVATRWSVHDVIGRIQSIHEGDDRARFIAVPDTDPATGKSNFDYDYNGFSEAFYASVEQTMDAVSYQCLYKNQPIEREGLLVHEDEIRTFLTLPVEKPDAIMSIADTKNKGTDYFVQPIFAKYGDDYYLIDCICDDNPDYGVQYDRSKSIIIRNEVKIARYEENNGGGRVAYEVQQLLNAEHYYCNVTSRFTEGNKETRIYVMMPWVKQHVLFKDKSMYTTKSDYGRLMEWLFKYSTVGKNIHDDVPDCLALFAEWQDGRQDRPTEIRRSPLAR